MLAIRPNFDKDFPFDVIDVYICTFELHIVNNP